MRASLATYGNWHRYIDNCNFVSFESSCGPKSRSVGRTGDSVIGLDATESKKPADIILLTLVISALGRTEGGADQGGCVMGPPSRMREQCLEQYSFLHVS